MNATKKAIIIGTGAGGLMAAAYLSKYDFEVVALEKAPSIGGYLKSFSRKGYHFDPGIHYIGECARGQMVHRILSEIGLDADDLFFTWVHEQPVSEFFYGRVFGQPWLPGGRPGPYLPCPGHPDP